MQHGDQQNIYGQTELDAEQELRNTDSHSQTTILSFIQESYADLEQPIPQYLYADHHKAHHYQDVLQSNMQLTP